MIRRCYSVELVPDYAKRRQGLRAEAYTTTVGTEVFVTVMQTDGRGRWMSDPGRERTCDSWEAAVVYCERLITEAIAVVVR